MPLLLPACICPYGGFGSRKSCAWSGPLPPARLSVGQHTVQQAVGWLIVPLPVALRACQRAMRFIELVSWALQGRAWWLADAPENKERLRANPSTNRLVPASPRSCPHRDFKPIAVWRRDGGKVAVPRRWARPKQQVVEQAQLVQPGLSACAAQRNMQHGMDGMAGAGAHMADPGSVQCCRPALRTQGKQQQQQQHIRRAGAPTCRLDAAVQLRTQPVQRLPHPLQVCGG